MKGFLTATYDYRLGAVSGAARSFALRPDAKWCASKKAAGDRFAMPDFKKLDVWQRAHALSLSIDRTCKRIRASQYYSLRNQIFTAALSIPANIADGRRKTSEKEFVRFLRIALSSSSELESHLIFAHDAKVISEVEFVPLVTETIRVRKMLYALIKRILSPQPPAAPPTAPSR